MIYLWLKIMYFKMINVLKGSWSAWCRIHAEAGTEPHTGARATDPNHWSSHTDAPGTFCPDAETISPETFGIVGFTREPGAPDDTIKTERLRRLIELGLVHEPDGLGDMIRIEQWHEDWARREAGDPSACPCGGRHYPEADACRWCRCHDPRNKHHAAPSVGIMQVIKPTFPRLGTTMPEDENRDSVTESSVRPPAEIVCCEACGHPQHAMGNGRCAFLVPLRAGYEDAVPDFCGCAVTPEEDEA